MAGETILLKKTWNVTGFASGEWWGPSRQKLEIRVDPWQAAQDFLSYYWRVAIDQSDHSRETVSFWADRGKTGGVLVCYRQAGPYEDFQRIARFVESATINRLGACAELCLIAGISDLFTLKEVERSGLSLRQTQDMLELWKAGESLGEVLAAYLGPAVH